MKQTHTRVILPLREDLPRLRRLERAVSSVAGWCSWRCPLAGVLLVLGAHAFSAPTWWRVTCDTATAILIALLSGSYGLDLALTGALVQRPDRWFEHVGRLVSILGGVALAALGIFGAWMVLKSSIVGT